MQAVPGSKLKRIENFLATQNKLWIASRQYKTELGTILRGQEASYVEKVQFMGAPKIQSRNLEEFSRMLGKSANEIAAGVARVPKATITTLKGGVKVVQGTIEYEEPMPSRYVAAQKCVIESGIRKISIILYPNQLLASVFAPVGTTIEQMAQKGLRFSREDLEIIKKANSHFEFGK